MSETFKNDNTGANIANFANQLKDNTSQQANQYNTSLKDGRCTVECDKNDEDVDVRRLIDDVNLPDASESKEFQSQETPLQRELEIEKQNSFNINQIIQLSGQQRKQLLNALLNAFPTKFLLKQLLSFELDKKLESFAGGDNLQEIVFNLIETAEAEGWVRELVCNAKKSNPENPLLIAIVQELSITCDY